MAIFRWRIGEVYVTATRNEDGTRTVRTTDAFFRDIDGPARVTALEAVNRELSSLREHIWFEELGHSRPEQDEPKR